MKKFVTFTNFITITLTITIISFFISKSSTASKVSVENNISNKSNSNIPVQFYGEKVNITLNDNEIIIDGLYYFRNLDKACKITILYPFPIGLSYSYPHFIHVEEKDYKLNNKGIYWNMNFTEHNEQQTVRVVYKQKVSLCKAEYIVITTKKWGKPLDFAEFYIDIPEYFCNFVSSYQLKEYSNNKKRKLYSFKKQMFWPDNNFIFSWNIANENN